MATRRQGGLKRRAVLAGGPVALAVPRSGPTQGRPRRIALLPLTAKDNPFSPSWLAALHEGLRERGWIDGQNLRLEVGYAGGDPKRVHDIAASFVAAAPDLIMATSTPAVDAVWSATKTLTVVFVLVVDPVALGYIQSMARPGGNITGFTFWDGSLVGKWLQLLKETDPRVERATILHHPDTTPYYPRMVEAVKRQPGLSAAPLSAVSVRTPGEIEPAIAAIAREPGAGLLPSDPFHGPNRFAIAEAALRHRVPSIAIFGDLARAGCRMSYGPVVDGMFKQSADYADRILRGAKPADLPAQAPTTFELVLNAGVAGELGLRFSPSALAAAEVLA